jgi:hypothetical protein
MEIRITMTNPERKRKAEFTSRQEHTGADGAPLLELMETMKEIIKRK